MFNWKVKHKQTLRVSEFCPDVFFKLVSDSTKFHNSRWFVCIDRGSGNFFLTNESKKLKCEENPTWITCLPSRVYQTRRRGNSKNGESAVQLVD